MAKKVLLKDANNQTIHPQTTNTQLVKENGTSFVPQEELVAGTGIAIDSQTNEISTTLTMNGHAPVDGNFVVPGSDTVTDQIIQNSTQAITSGAIYTLLGGSQLPNLSIIRYRLIGAKTQQQLLSFFNNVKAQVNTFILKMKYTDYDGIGIYEYNLNEIVITPDAQNPNDTSTTFYYVDSTGTTQILSNGLGNGDSLDIFCVNMNLQSGAI